MQPDWDLANTLIGGTRAMRHAGAKYLPKFPAEDDEDWKRRLGASVLFPAFKRTVSTLAAKPFSRPVTLSDDTPERLKTWLEDIDLQGRKLAIFAADLLEDALGPGIAGILVEYPRADGVRTRADEAAAGLRPYWIHIKSSQFLGWRAQRLDGTWKLTQLRFMESVDVDDGPWGTKSIDQVRVLTPGRWETYRESETAKDEWALHDAGETSLKVVPFIPIYGERTGFMTGKSPLLEVAHLNVKHWQSQSDQDNLLHLARVPILVATGTPLDFEFKIGSASAIKLGDPNADMKFVEHSGAAINAGRQSLEDLKEEMRQAGAELLVIQPGKKTATQVGAEESVGMCSLAKIAETLEDALDAAMQLTADWVGEKSGGSVTLFKDFGVAPLAEITAQLLIDIAKSGRISDETLRAEMKRRGVLSADVDEAEEVERLAKQPPDDPNPSGIPAA